jgi:hypothetical protein
MKLQRPRFSWDIIPKQTEVVSYSRRLVPERVIATKPHTFFISWPFFSPQVSTHGILLQPTMQICMATASHKDRDRVKESQINRNKYYCLGGISKRITHPKLKTKEPRIREREGKQPAKSNLLPFLCYRRIYINSPLFFFPVSATAPLSTFYCELLEQRFGEERSSPAHCIATP